MNEPDIQVIKAKSIKDAINKGNLKVQIPLSKPHTIKADGFKIRISASTGQLTVTIQLGANTVLDKEVTSLRIKITQEGATLPKKAFYFDARGSHLLETHLWARSI